MTSLKRSGIPRLTPTPLDLWRCWYLGLSFITGAPVLRKRLDPNFPEMREGRFGSGSNPISLQNHMKLHSPRVRRGCSEVGCGLKSSLSFPLPLNPFPGSRKWISPLPPYTLGIFCRVTDATVWRQGAPSCPGISPRSRWSLVKICGRDAGQTV